MQTLMQTVNCIVDVHVYVCTLYNWHMHVALLQSVNCNVSVHTLCDCLSLSLSQEWYVARGPAVHQEHGQCSDRGILEDGSRLNP